MVLASPSGFTFLPLVGFVLLGISKFDFLVFLKGLLRNIFEDCIYFVGVVLIFQIFLNLDLFMIVLRSSFDMKRALIAQMLFYRDMAIKYTENIHTKTIYIYIPKLSGLK